jgi:RNA polymerase sigma-70 factor (ECF subfamily)
LRAIARPEDFAKFLASIGMGQHGDEDGLRRLLDQYSARVVEVNGAPAFIAAVAECIVAVLSAEVAGGRITTLYLIANPEKLARLARAERTAGTPSPPGVAGTSGASGMSRTGEGAAS